MRLTIAALVVVAACSSKEEDNNGSTRQAPAGEAAAAAAAPSPPPRAAPLTFDRAFLDAMAAKGYTLDGPEPPATAMREGLATALTAMTLDQGLAVAFNVKKTTLVVNVVDGTGCTKEKITAVAEMADPALGSAGFTRIKCEPEGYSIPVR